MKADTPITRLVNQIHVEKLKGFVHVDVQPLKMARLFLLTNYITKDETEQWVVPNCPKDVPDYVEKFMRLNDEDVVTVSTEEEGGKSTKWAVLNCWTEFLAYKPLNKDSD